MFSPIQNGDEVESASTCGRKYRAAFMMWIGRSRSAIPT